MPRNGLRKNPKKRISGIPASALRKPLVTTTCDANQDDGVNIFFNFGKIFLINLFSSICFQVFSHEQELALKKYLQQSAKLYSGLTSKTARELAFKYALKLQKAQVLKKMPSNWCLNKMTGEDWLNEYLKRHPDLSFEWPQTPLENAVNKRILASQGDGVNIFFRFWEDFSNQFVLFYLFSGFQSRTGTGSEEVLKDVC